MTFVKTRKMTPMCNGRNFVPGFSLVSSLVVELRDPGQTWSCGLLSNLKLQGPGLSSTTICWRDNYMLSRGKWNCQVVFSKWPISLLWSDGAPFVHVVAIVSPSHFLDFQSYSETISQYIFYLNLWLILLLKWAWLLWIFSQRTKLSCFSLHTKSGKSPRTASDSSFRSWAISNQISDFVFLGMFWQGTVLCSNYPRQYIQFCLYHSTLGRKLTSLSPPSISSLWILQRVEEYEFAETKRESKQVGWNQVSWKSFNLKKGEKKKLP